MAARAILLVLSALLVGCTAPKTMTTDASITTIHVVRHAEKLNVDSDTPLSPVGEQRALALADRMKDAGVQVIYATTKQRTQQTVAPLAKELGLVPVIMDPHAVDSLVARIVREDRGRVVLVAAHNHTVPQIVKGLSGREVEGIPEQVFDRLYQVRLRSDGTAEVEVLQYGVPTP